MPVITTSYYNYGITQPSGILISNRSVIHVLELNIILGIF